MLETEIFSWASVCIATVPTGKAVELKIFHFLKNSDSVLFPDLQKVTFRTFVYFPRGYLRSQQLYKHTQLSDIGD